MRLSDRLAALDDAGRASLAARLPPLPAIGRRLWTASRLAPDSSLYNVVEVFRLRGPVDVDRLRAALDALYARHHGLRSVVVDLGDGPRAARLPSADGFPFEVHESAGPSDPGEDTPSPLVREFAARPLDLVDGPVVRALLVREGPDDWTFVVVMHHMVCDGQSLHVFLTELSALYAGASPTTLPPVVDPSAAQRGLERNPHRERDLAYWRDRLAGAPVDPVLPTDHPRPEHPDHRAARVAVPLAEGWPTAARHPDGSLFDVALAALGEVLGRFGRVDDLVVGTTVDMRPEARAEGAVGFFMRTVPLRLAPAGEVDVAGAHRAVVGALEHSGVEFDDIVTAVGHSGSRATPLFQVALELHQEGSPLELPGVAVTPIMPTEGSAKFDLSFHLDAAGGQSFLEYATALYDEHTARGLAAALAATLTGAAVPSAPVVGVPLPEHAPTTLPAALRAAAGRTPEHPAVVCDGDGEIDYRALVRRADALGAVLGATPGEPVGLCLRRSTAQVVALFGVWSAGGTCVLLDPDLPEARLRLMLAALGVTRVVVDVTTGEHPAFGDVARFTVPAHGSDAGPVREVTGAEVAYVVFTSGTSGAPKPVAVRHDSLTAFDAAMRVEVQADLPPGSPVAVNAPLHFDASMQNLQLLRHGHTVVVVDETSRTDPPAMVAMLAKHRVKALDCTPTHAEALVRAGLLEPGTTELERLVLGGEAVRRPLWDAARASGVRVFNVYGPTEFTVNATASPIDDAHPRPTIGRPLPGTVVEILDERLRPVPPGFPGELHLSGAQLAVGYLGAPARTAERFRPAPGAARRYATGDLGRLTASGDIEFLGRVDEQVKLRGHRVEPAEVEGVLRGAPGVREAAVTVLDPDGSTPVLAAFLVASDVGPARARAVELLPPYAVPAAFHLVDRLPTTPSGKLDRKALRAVEVAAPVVAARPMTDDETRLAAVWSDLLGRAVSDADADFFASGGNSLLFTSLLRRITAEFGVTVSTHRAFRARTLAAMAELVRRDGGDTGLVVTLAEGSGTPLVVLHPLGGTLVSYAPLLRLLPEGRPVWGVRSPAAAGEPDEPGDVDALVARYRDALLPRLTGRRVALFGWSLGGLLALSLTSALERRGIVVESTEMWDCGLGTADEYDEAELRDLANQAVFGDAPPDPASPELRRTLRLLRRQTGLFRTWTPEPVDAPLHTVYAAESLRTGVVTRTDWSAHSRGGGTERVVETDHHGIVRPPAVARAADGLIARHRKGTEL